VSVVLAAALALVAAAPALASGPDTGGKTPTPQTLAAMKAQADVVQQQLTVGVKNLEAAQSKLAALQAKAAAATTAAAKVGAELARLRKKLGTYAAELYMRPTGELAMAALASQGDLASSVRGVQMLSIVNRGRSEVLREVAVEAQRVEVLQTQAAQAAAAAAVVQKSVTVQVTALQLKASQAESSLTAAQAAYQAELARVAAIRLAAARAARQQAARDQAARALAARRAAALAAEGTDPTAPVGGCAPGGPYPSGPWGGYSDGFVPSSQLCAIIGGGRLRPDAALAFNRMSSAYAAAFGSNLCVNDSYRSYSEQVAVFRQRPRLAAIPGTSNHGWGLAVDLGCGVQSSRTAQYRWMTANAGRFGWVHPAWAVRSPFEPWHWEFGHLAGTGGT
jgi:hypothetical protein